MKWLKPKNSLPNKKEMILIKDAVDAVTNVYQNQMRYRNGGMANALSGAGGPSDKSAFFTMLPFWLCDNGYIERVCIQSWMAGRFVSMPIDDMFAKPRLYTDEKFKAESMRLNVDKRMASTLKLGRKFGTGLLWVVSNEASPDTPMDINKIRQGDVTNIISIDRHDVSIVSVNGNPLSTNFNMPEIYRINIRGFGSINVHASRVYRSDGQEADSVNGWRSYEPSWGVSSLTAVMTDVFNDVAVVDAISQLMQEASIPVHKIDGLNEIMCRGKLADEQGVEETMEYVSLYKSIYRTMFMDAEDTFDRTSVNFSNIPDLMDRFEERLAMASGMSTTRFLGKGASGLNATGEGDQRNDSKTTRIRQTQLLEPFYSWIDPVIARSAGTSVPQYSFPPLFEMSQKEVSEMELNRSKSAGLNVKHGIWMPSEGMEYVARGVFPDTDPSRKMIPEKESALK